MGMRARARARAGCDICTFFAQGVLCRGFEEEEEEGFCVGLLFCLWMEDVWWSSEGEQGGSSGGFGAIVSGKLYDETCTL